MPGRFITLEGGEGVGKSTQLVRLADALRTKGISVVTTREPGGTAGAESIRQLLMTGNHEKWTSSAESLLFAAARSDHVDKVIRPALARGDWVVCDRFIDSSRAYQGGGGGLSDDDILALHRIGSDGLMPDRTFLLDMPADDGILRTQARSAGMDDRMGSKDKSYYEAVRARFRRMADTENGRFVIIDAQHPADAVTQCLMAGIADFLP